MAQVIDLAAARKQRKPEPKPVVQLRPVSRKDAKRMQAAQAVQMAHIGRL